MSRTSLDFLFRVERPFVHLGVGEADRTEWTPSHFYSHGDTNVCVRRLRGAKMLTTAAVMNEVGAALQLFIGFGENWYALEECLSYLDEWLPADSYVLVVEEAEHLLQDEPDSLGAFLKTVNNAAAFWSARVDGNGRFDRPARPFHFLLNLSSTDEPSQERIIRAALEAAVVVGIIGR